MSKVVTLERLRALIPGPTPQAPKKIHRRLNARARAFIGCSPLALLATSDDAGQPTVSPKGDVPGFARVLDDETLLLPERPGNRLIFSLQNLLLNPGVGLLFLVPGTCETLRVGGEADLDDDPGLCASFTARGKPALLVTRVKVTECYFHCAKAMLRSELWRPETWPAPMEISFGAEIAEEGGLGELTAEALDEGVRRRYRTDL